MENRWQPMSAETWCGPSSRSTSFIAVKMGRSGQPVQKPGGRLCTSGAGWMGMTRDVLAFGTASTPWRCRKAFTPVMTTPAVYSPATGSRSLPCRAQPLPAARRTAAMFCSMKLGCPSSTSSTARLPAQNSSTSSSTTG